MDHMTPDPGRRVPADEPSDGCRDVETALRRQTQTYRVLMDISARCINIPMAEADSAIHSALETVGRFVGADRAYVFDYDFGRGVAVNTHEWCNAGIEPQIRNLQASPLDAAPEWIDAHLQGRSVVIPDTSALPGGGIREILLAQGIRSLISVPMFCGGVLRGFTGFDSVASLHRYTDGEIQLMEFLGRILVNLRIRVEAERQLVDLNRTLDEKVRTRTEKLRRLNEHLIDVEERERKAVAVDLHDSVTQTLGMCVSRLKGVEESFPRMDPPTVTEVREYLQQALREVRTLIYNLSPPILDDFDIDVALGVLIEEFNGGGGFRVRYENRYETLTMPRSVKVLLYRSAQELIRNCIKHSGGTGAELVLTTDGSDVRLTVRDRGKGFDVSALEGRSNRSFGLYSISERVGNMGGTLDLVSRPGRGTTVTLSIPCLG
jgi:signal transduction histidine kinase